MDFKVELPKLFYFFDNATVGFITTPTDKKVPATWT